MPNRVTIAIPVYKRLRHLPIALGCVAAQTHRDIELIVSDNGMNGDAVPSLVAQHYHRPFRVRRNTTPAPLVAHLNQLLAEATGEYFVVLCDDDEISPTFAAELSDLLDRHAGAHVALARPETMNVDGGDIRQFDGIWPARLSGDDFVRAWSVKRLRLMSTITLMARTASARACGGYADFPRALFSDNLLLVKLALAGDVVLAPTSFFRWRLDAASTGFSAHPREVAGACRLFLQALSSDRDLLAYAASHPETWRELKYALREQAASWYFFRWIGYEMLLSRRAWIRAALQPSFTPAYYRRVLETLTARGKASLAHRYPSVHRTYRRLRRRPASGKATGQSATTA